MFLADKFVGLRFLLVSMAGVGNLDFGENSGSEMQVSGKPKYSSGQNDEYEQGRTKVICFSYGRSIILASFFGHY
jgi:hypothetical protein